MSSKSLSTLGGVALILSALIGPLGPAFHPPDHSLASIPTWNWPVAHSLDAFTYALRLFGIIVVYARISHRLGVLGLGAFVLMTLVQIESLSYALQELNMIPALAASSETRNVLAIRPPVNLRAYGSLTNALYLIGAIAAIVFGVLVMREWRAARWAGFAFITGVIASFAGIALAGMLKNTIPVILGYTVLSLGYGWFGVMLTRDEEPTLQHAMSEPAMA